MADANEPQSTPIGELRRLKTLVEEIAASLRSQRELLKMRGMSLPPLVMQTLSAIESDISKLEASMVNDQTELSQLRSLADTSALTNSSLDPEEVLNRAMDTVITLTGAERGYIILKDHETGDLNILVGRESELLPKHGGENGPEISSSVIRDVLETGQPLLADNAYKDERLQGNVSIARFTLRSVLCVPLKYKDDIIGVVYVDNRMRSGVFEEREKTLLSAFSNQAAVAIENARLYTSIQQATEEIGGMKELMDNVFASIGGGVITTDTRNQVQTFNRAAEIILGKSPEQAIGHRLSAILPGVSADLDKHLSEVQEEAESQVMDAEMEVPGRGRIFLNIKLSPLKDADQSTQGVALVLDDLTEQRKREEQLNIVNKYLPPQMVAKLDEISRLPLGGEQRQVTCIYVNVLPLYIFPDHYRPQQIVEGLNVYLSKATECLHSTEGVIDKYMGNVIMGLFNTQLNPMDDHAVRAVEAALNIRDTFHRLYQELGIRPESPYYCMGINTGIATLGNVGSLRRREFTAIGDTINTAKRLEENARRGQILISQSTRDQIEKIAPSRRIRIENRDPITAKGKGTVIIHEVFRAT
ncbi:MAG: GAF domain-containing protein [bacterium]|nr:GAF domain-containing protein [bacterium]